ncbi:MAG: hypothetical protein CMH28_06465 [Micavibrio sp.]|nr:hypothetical protein [Micavibrio sp.]
MNSILPSFDSASERNFYLAFTTFIIAQFFITYDNIWDWIFYIAVIPALIVFCYKTPFKRQSFFTTELVILLVTMFWLSLTLFWQDNLSFPEGLKFIKHLIFSLIFIFSCYCFFIRNSNDKNLFFWKASISATLVGCLISLSLYLLNSTDFSTRMEPYGQLEQSILGASVYGIFGLFSLHLGLEKKNLKEKAFYFSAYAFILVLILLTYSRAPIAIFVTTSAALLFIRLPRRVVFRYVLLAFLTGILLAIIPFTKTIMFDYIDALLERGLSYRLDVWGCTLKMISQKPLLGYGASSPFVCYVEGYKLAHPHNLFLGITYTSGIIGLFLFSIFSAVFTINIIRKSHGQKRLFYTIIITYCFLSVLTDNPSFITAPSPFWTFFWLPLVYVYTKTKYPEETDR